MSQDTITVLACPANTPATKTITRTNSGVDIQGFNAGKYFTSKSYPVSSIEELSSILTTLEKIPNALVIRGAPCPALNVGTWHRRTKHQPRNYATPLYGRRYVMIDIDKLELPPGMKLVPRTVESVVQFVIGKLPDEFHDASFHWQLSSTSGIRDQSKVSVHLWFWLKQPVTDGDLRRWGRHANAQIGFTLIDTALFNDVQAHYTAAPIFRNMRDPFPRRCGLVLKTNDEVELSLPPAAAPVAKAKNGHPSKGSGITESSGIGFETFLNSIGDHPGGDGFHGPIIRATASYVATHSMDEAEKERLFALVRDRVLKADRTHHEPEYVEQMASHDHIMDAINGAIAKFGNSANSRRSRLMDLPKSSSIRKYRSPEHAREIIRRSLKAYL